MARRRSPLLLPTRSPKEGSERTQTPKDDGPAYALAQDTRVVQLRPLTLQEQIAEALEGVGRWTRLRPFLLRPLMRAIQELEGHPQARPQPSPEGNEGPKPPV